MLRKKVEDTTEKDNTFNGTFDVKKFDSALAEIQDARQIPVETTHELLRQAIDKAARDTIDSRNSADMHTETVIDSTTGQIRFYECKDVVENVEDDLYQIEADEAKQIDSNLKVGDVYKVEDDLTKLDYQFFTRTIQYFQQKIKEATKQALVDCYKDKIGEIITGVVEKIDGGFVTLSINKVMTILTPQNTIPGEHFAPGDEVKVLLKGVGTTDESGDKTTQLVVTRTDDRFLEKLFEIEVPDIADGSVKIKGIAREPGSRAKVAVYSDFPDVDPTGACIGSDGKRIKDICGQLGAEKIDVIKYQENPYLFVAEALKPATVVGVVFKDDGKAIAIVKNAESKIAIGKRGVNVRLASRLSGHSIDIKEQDAAMNEHLSYQLIDDLKRKQALDKLDSIEQDTDSDENATAEDAAPISTEETASQPAAETAVAAASAPAIETSVAPAAEKTAAVTNAVQATPVAATVAPAPVSAQTVTVEATIPTPVVSTTVVPAPAVVEAKPTHVEITSKAKISLTALEAEIEREKKRKPVVETASYGYGYKKHYDNKNSTDDKKKKDDVKKPDVANAMPIYTQEELDEMNKEDQESKDTGTSPDIDLEAYDDDQYYDGGTK